MALTNRQSNTSDTGNETFPFLRLPPEIRIMIYHLHLTSERILPRRRRSERWTPINLLYVNRIIYKEAFSHLYSKGDFVLAVRPQSISVLDTCLRKRALRASQGPDIFARSKELSQLIRHISLDIHWCSVEHLRPRNPQSPSNMLKTSMHIMATSLSRLPALRTIDISFVHLKLIGSQDSNAAPPKYRIPGWLRGLKLVRRANDMVRIGMPLEGPVSTEELERDQGIVDEDENFWKELLEDHDEFIGWYKER